MAPQFPPVDAALLAALDAAFPALRIKPVHTLPEIMHNAGAREVVAFLKAHLELQQKPGKQVS